MTAQSAVDTGARRTAPPARAVLMFAYYFPPGNFTGARRPLRFARYLRGHGYHTHVVTAQPQSGASPWPDAVCALPDRSWKTMAAQALHRVLPYNDQVTWVPAAVEAARAVCRAQRPEAVISTSPPVASHLAALAVKRLCGLPWVADFRDPLYGNPSRDRWWGGLWDAPVDRLIAREADAIIANTDAAADMLRARYPRLARKIHLIWNGYDPEAAIGPRPLPRRDFKLMVHAGSLYGQRHPTAVLGSLHRLVAGGRLKAGSIRLRLVGHFYREDPWVSQSRFNELVEAGVVEYTPGMVSAGDAAREMAEADCLLLLDLNDRGLGIQVPAKVFEYIQTGRPVLAFTARNSPVERILAGSGVRHVIVYPDLPAEEMDRRVLEGLRLPSDAVAPSSWFHERFNGASQAEALARILDSLVKQSQ